MRSIIITLRSEIESEMVTQLGQHWYAAPSVRPYKPLTEVLAGSPQPYTTRAYVGTTDLHLSRQLLIPLVSHCVDRSASYGYLEILEHLLEYDGCDVDPQNRIEKATPLHLALRIEDAELRKAVVASLLEAGADTR